MARKRIIADAPLLAMEEEKKEKVSVNHCHLKETALPFQFTSRQPGSQGEQAEVLYGWFTTAWGFNPTGLLCWSHRMFETIQQRKGRRNSSVA